MHKSWEKKDPNNNETCLEDVAEKLNTRSRFYQSGNYLLIVNNICYGNIISVYGIINQSINHIPSLA